MSAGVSDAEIENLCRIAAKEAAMEIVRRLEPVGWLNHLGSLVPTTTWQAEIPTEWRTVYVLNTDGLDV